MPVTFRHHRSTAADRTDRVAAPTPTTFPWERSQAAPEDRAIGLELELIELERRRGEAIAGSSVADELDAEIAEVRALLGELLVDLVPA